MRDGLTWMGGAVRSAGLHAKPGAGAHIRRRAVGGSISAETGWLWNTIALGGELFTSLPVVAPDSRPADCCVQLSLRVCRRSYRRCARSIANASPLSRSSIVPSPNDASCFYSEFEVWNIRREGCWLTRER